MKITFNNDTAKTFDVRFADYSYLRNGENNRTIRLSVDAQYIEAALKIVLAMIENGESVTDLYLIDNNGAVVYNHLKDTFTIDEVTERAEDDRHQLDINLTKV